jgi:hypothetical protein
MTMKEYDLSQPVVVAPPISELAVQEVTFAQGRCIVIYQGPDGISKRVITLATLQEQSDIDAIAKARIEQALGIILTEKVKP